MAAGLVALAFNSTDLAANVSPGKPRMTVHKSPACGCCGAWVKQMRAAGFDIEERNVEDVGPIKTRFGVPSNLASCHTAVIGNYAFEGHVPADLIRQFLRQPPRDARGLAVPGMPIGSPGMEMRGRKDPYDVVLFKSNGRKAVFARR